MDMSEKIRTLRKERGLTLEAVGEHVGVGKSTVRKWENGYIKNMRRDKIALLAEALGVSPGYLMGWETDDVKEKLHDIGQQLTPLSRSNAPPGLTSTDYALHDVMLSLSEGARQDVLEFALFRQAQEKKEKARHDD